MALKQRLLKAAGEAGHWTRDRFNGAKAMLDDRTGAEKEPGVFNSVEDVRHYCQEGIKWGAGVVDGVALIVGTFAVSASVHTFGISFGHFFALCAVMGLLYSLAVGAAELYAVTSLLVREGHSSPATEALRLCATPRRYRRGQRDTAEVDGDVDEPTDTATPTEASPQARILAGTWVKLSLAGAMPVFNDRHMQDRLDALLPLLRSREQHP